VRVMMLCDSYDPVIGGAQRHVQTLSRELAGRGHSVAVVTLWRRGWAKEETDPYGVQIHRIGGWTRALKPFFSDPRRHFHPPAPDPGAIRELASIVRKFAPDIVNSHSWIVYSYLAIAGQHQARIVYTLHDYRLICPKQNYLHHGAECSGPGLRKCLGCAPEQYGRVKGAALTGALMASSLLHSRVDRYVAVSAAVAAASRAGTHKPPRGLVVVPSVVPDGIVQEGLEAPRPNFLPAADGFVLFVGALTAGKGLGVLLDAYQRLRSEAPLVLLGTVRADTPTELPPGVVLERDVPHRDVMASWLRAAVGVMPSLVPEGLGHAAIEAMACGKPVVASAIGALPEVVAHGETGLLVPADDAPALAEALDALLGDPARRARMGAEAKRRAERFTVSAVVDRVERLFEDLMEER
jgi:glycosyltransferase involved in cell wall biosynthesis